jgi:hypothetical protein
MPDDTSWLASLDNWLTTPPPDSPCDCGKEDCEECEFCRRREDARDRAMDQAIDEAKEREWDR